MNRIAATKNDLLTKALDLTCAQSGLNPPVLQAITNHAMRIEARETAETGCGLSTVILSAIADCHICFTVAQGNSLQKVQGVPHIPHNDVIFIIGPSQLTLPRYSFARPAGLGPDRRSARVSVAQMEYFHFYQILRKGGVLVVDDIHIPTIRQMYDFLRDDKMWTHLEDVMNTAFFQRTDAPMFDPFGDGWERQQFNQRHFDDSASMDIYCPGCRANMPPPPGPLLGAASAAEAEGAPSAPVGASEALHAEIARLRSDLLAHYCATPLALSNVRRS